MLWNAAATLDNEKYAEIMGQIKGIDGDEHE